MCLAMLIKCFILCNAKLFLPGSLALEPAVGKFSDGTKHLTDISISRSRFFKAGYTWACIFLNFEDLDS